MSILKRFPFVLLALMCLIFGFLTGLNRIGWSIFASPATAHHGAIMIGGFLGTLIALEKLIPLKNRILFLVPVLSGGSLVLFLLNFPYAAMTMLLCASFFLCCIFAFYLYKHRELQYVMMLLGAISWFIGNTLLLTKKMYPLSFPWWLGFILFVIIGERLEITKFLPVTGKQKSVVFFFLLLYFISCLVSFHGIGNIISGVALIGISVWLLRYDIIRISISKTLLTKYVAMALLCGYVALMLCGIFFITMKGSLLAYDALIHTFFLGFTFSMIFAHGPIILPGVLGISVKPYHKIFYVWLILLQVSWLVRVYADVRHYYDLRSYTGLVSMTAILGYFISLAALTIKAYRGKSV